MDRVACQKNANHLQMIRFFLYFCKRKKNQNWNMSKKSIRFFNDREVRAVWDEDRSKWWFSATDIVRAINDEDDYVKAGNYWRWLKKKFNDDGIQLVSITHDFKFRAPDGKQRAADALDAECVQTLAKKLSQQQCFTAQ